AEVIACLCECHSDELRLRRIIRATLQRRVGNGGKHPFDFWARFTARLQQSEPKSPRLGYAPPECRMKPWPFFAKEARMARIAGWFPPFARENNTASMSLRLRMKIKMMKLERHSSSRAASSMTTETRG